MTEETQRPHGAITVVLVATIAAAVYLLTPLAWRIGGGRRLIADGELHDAVEDLTDRVDRLTGQVRSAEDRLRRS
jgi:hypothetical protein